MNDRHQHADSISAIIVSYKTGPVLADCLSALDREESVAEIILVDNGNPVGAVDDAISDVKTPVRVLFGHGNIGFSAGCNRGAASASNDHLLFLNPDAVISSGGPARLLQDSVALDKPWLMGVMLIGPDGKEQQGSRRAELTPWRAIFEASYLARLAPTVFSPFNLHRTPRPGELAEIPTLSGACLFIKAAVFHAMGGMDEAYFLHVEDIDFCKRFRKAGGQVWFNPAVTVTHHKSSSDAPRRDIEAHKTRGLIRYFNVHFEDTWPAPARWVLARMLWAAFWVRTFGQH